MNIPTIKDEHGEFIATRLYEFNAGIYCGVFMPEHVMKKLVRLQADHEANVRRLLDDHKAELHSADWTCASHKEDGSITKQVRIKYVSKEGQDVDRRIALFKPTQPVMLERVYLVDDYQHGNRIAESLLAESLETT